MVAVAQFHGLMLAGRGSAGHNGSSNRAARQLHFRFYRRIAARIQHLVPDDGCNVRHTALPSLSLYEYGIGESSLTHATRLREPELKVGSGPVRKQPLVWVCFMGWFRNPRLYTEEDHGNGGKPQPAHFPSLKCNMPAPYLR